jgi:hypothetical protein
MFGLRFILDKVARAVDEQMNDEDVIRQQLMEAQMRFEAGELSAEELADAERELLPRLRQTDEPIDLTGAHAEVEVTGLEDVEAAPVEKASAPKRKSGKRKRR